MTAKFDSLEQLKKVITSACKEVSTETIIGYIEPGHGNINKGKQRWLTSTDDLAEMYTLHEGKKEILLWAYSLDQSSKRRCGSPNNEQCKRTRYDTHVDKMIQVEEIESDLRDKHLGEGYSEEQLRSWAHLIQLKKHSSYDVPPNKPFWNIPKKAASSGSPSSSGANKKVTVSPGKRVNLRGQCVQQLGQFYDLLEKGAISRQQYHENLMQKTIMDEVKKY